MLALLTFAYFLIYIFIEVRSIYSVSVDLLTPTLTWYLIHPDSRLGSLHDGPLPSVFGDGFSAENLGISNDHAWWEALKALN